MTTEEQVKVWNKFCRLRYELIKWHNKETSRDNTPTENFQIEKLNSEWVKTVQYLHEEIRDMARMIHVGLFDSQIKFGLQREILSLIFLLNNRETELVKITSFVWDCVKLLEDEDEGKEFLRLFDKIEENDLEIFCWAELDEVKQYMQKIAKDKKLPKVSITNKIRNVITKFVKR
jgi:hypothetical protein